MANKVLKKTVATESYFAKRKKKQAQYQAAADRHAKRAKESDKSHRGSVQTRAQMLLEKARQQKTVVSRKKATKAAAKTVTKKKKKKASG